MGKPLFLAYYNNCCDSDTRFKTQANPQEG